MQREAREPSLSLDLGPRPPLLSRALISGLGRGKERGRALISGLGREKERREGTTRPCARGPGLSLHAEEHGGVGGLQGAALWT